MYAYCLLQTSLYQYLLGWRSFHAGCERLPVGSTARFCWNDASVVTAHVQLRKVCYKCNKLRHVTCTYIRILDIAQSSSFHLKSTKRVSWSCECHKQLSQQSFICEVDLALFQLQNWSAIMGTILLQVFAILLLWCVYTSGQTDRQRSTT